MFMGESWSAVLMTTKNAEIKFRWWCVGCQILLIVMYKDKKLHDEFKPFLMTHIKISIFRAFFFLFWYYKNEFRQHTEKSLHLWCYDCQQFHGSASIHFKKIMKPSNRLSIEQKLSSILTYKFRVTHTYFASNLSKAIKLSFYQK